MHRSGTSAITRIINLLGADLPSNLIDSAPDNELGFWESQYLANLHEELLNFAGLRWYDFDQFPIDWLNSLKAKQFQISIQKFLQEEFSDSNIFVIKDPRICRFFPIWFKLLDHIEITPKIIFQIRNPLEVAKSLETRNKFIPAKAYLLWLRYILDAEYHTRLIPRSIINFEELLNDWRSVISKISNDLNIKWFKRTQKIDVNIDNFLLPRLRHHEFSIEDFSEQEIIVDWIKNAYLALCNLAQNINIKEQQKILDEITIKFNNAYSALEPIFNSNPDNLKNAELLTVKLNRVIRHLTKEITPYNERVKKLQATLNEVVRSVSKSEGP